MGPHLALQTTSSVSANSLGAETWGSFVFPLSSLTIPWISLSAPQTPQTLKCQGALEIHTQPSSNSLVHLTHSSGSGPTVSPAIIPDALLCPRTLFLAEISTQNLLSPCPVLDTGFIVSNKTQPHSWGNVLSSGLLIQYNNNNSLSPGCLHWLGEGRRPPGEVTL